ncbi:MAG: hypothetical protein ABEJ42_09455 [Halobacteriaceae archaeon]
MPWTSRRGVLKVAGMASILSAVSGIASGSEGGEVATESDVRREIRNSLPEAGWEQRDANTFSKRADIGEQTRESLSAVPGIRVSIRDEEGSNAVILHVDLEELPIPTREERRRARKRARDRREQAREQFEEARRRHMASSEAPVSREVSIE